jgi:hypothetical protein
MKFTARTLAILKNFIGINPSIVLRSGNKLRTISKTGTIYAEATITEEMPIDVGISNLSKFLSLVSLYDNPDIEFADRQFIIRSEDGKQKTYYIYDEINNIIAPPKDKTFKFEDSDEKFELKQDIFNNVLRAANILGLEDVAFVGDGEKVYFSAFKTNESSKDEHHIEIGETDNKFKLVMRSESLKFLPDDYMVTVSTNNKIKFESSDVMYSIALETKKTTRG